MDNETWGNPFAAAAQSPLAGDWSSYMTDQMPSTGWWQDFGQGFGYTGNQWRGMDYAPGGPSMSYGPMSGMTNKIIDSDIDAWMRREFPEMYDFTNGGSLQPGVGVGKVGSKPGFGQFDAGADAEIQAAANRYGVPANFLKAIIAHESSGDWAYNNRAPLIGTRGERILPYVGVFESAAKSWGFDFNSLIGNRAGQIMMLASGLRGMYDRLRSQNPQYGWEQVSNYHYSGNPTGSYTPGDAYQYGTTQQYTGKVMNWWKELDAFAGNTWGNYTDVTQNTGIGSPQTQAWGQYAKWDQALVGLSGGTGAPANVLKGILRYGQEVGLNYTGNFDANFTPVAERVAQEYQRTGSWNQAVANAIGQPVNSAAVTRIMEYKNELDADMSGVFGGAPNVTNGNMLQYKAVWGGTDYPITQEHGPTPFSIADPLGYYEYSIGVLGMKGHPGIDVGMSAGTRLYAPVSGTVIRAGNASYPTNKYLGPVHGELRIRTDSGHDLILGHMGAIDVRVGDRVTPGMYVGLSGSLNGDHLHLEYRIPSTRMSSGWEAIDPRLALGGQFTGYNQGARTGLGYTTPLTFQNLMRAGASGTPIPSGATFQQGGGNSGWTSWLANAMRGTQQQETRSGQLDYSKIFAQSSTGLAGGGHYEGDGHNH